METMIVVGAIGCIFGCLGHFVAVGKQRSGTEGFALGFLFGPLGVLIECLMPTVYARPARSTHYVVARPAPFREDEIIERIRRGPDNVNPFA